MIRVRQAGGDLYFAGPTPSEVMTTRFTVLSRL